MSKPKARNTLNSKKAGVLDDKEIQDITDEHFKQKELEAANQSKPVGTIQMVQHTLRCPKKKPVAIKCSVCDEKFPSQCATNEHIHGKYPEYKFICKYCMKTFDTYNACYKHEKAYGTLKHACQKCPKHFQFPVELVEHNQVHTRQDLIPCTNCPQHFTSNHGMMLHAKIHQGYIFQCQQCPYNSTSQSNLDQHTCGCHGEKWTTKCGEVYSWCHQIRRHEDLCDKC